MLDKICMAFASLWAGKMRVLLIMLGIIGEYIGRIYDESKNRPLYVIAERKGFDDGQEDKQVR